MLLLLLVWQAQRWQRCKCHAWLPLVDRSSPALLRRLRQRRRGLRRPAAAGVVEALLLLHLHLWLRLLAQQRLAKLLLMQAC